MQAYCPQREAGGIVTLRQKGCNLFCLFWQSRLLSRAIGIFIIPYFTAYRFKCVFDLFDILFRREDLGMVLRVMKYCNCIYESKVFHFQTITGLLDLSQGFLRVFGCARFQKCGGPGVRLICLYVACIPR